MSTETLLDRLYEVMKEKHIERKDLPNVLGLKRSTINGWYQKGRTSMTDKYLNIICEKLNVNEMYLRKGEEPKFKNQNNILFIPVITPTLNLASATVEFKQVSSKPFLTTDLKNADSSLCQIVIVSDNNSYPYICKGDYVMFEKKLTEISNFDKYYVIETTEHSYVFAKINITSQTITFYYSESNQTTIDIGTFKDKYIGVYPILNIQRMM